MSKVRSEWVVTCVNWVLCVVVVARNEKNIFLKTFKKNLNCCVATRKSIPLHYWKVLKRNSKIRMNDQNIFSRICWSSTPIVSENVVKRSRIIIHRDSFFWFFFAQNFEFCLKLFTNLKILIKFCLNEFLIAFFFDLILNI